jgi:hypothetical protein
MSPSKQKLLELEKSGKYVFHGTSEDIEIFEPRQARNYFDGKYENDGEPAVYASDHVEYAIFMAIFNKRNCPISCYSRSGATSTTGQPPVLVFGAKKSTIEQLTNEAKGWVYVFDKSTFKLRNDPGVEYVSQVHVKPLERILVKKEDLPRNIEADD